MFAAGDYIVYGTSGVCLVSSVCPSPFDKNDVRIYYELKPVHAGGNSTIYIPVNNSQVAMRPLMTPDEAEKLIRGLKDIPMIELPAEKMRRDVYRSIMAGQNPERYISLIKTVRQRRAECLASHKRLPDTDNEYEVVAKKSLYAELSIALGVPYEKMDSYLMERI